MSIKQIVKVSLTAFALASASLALAESKTKAGDADIWLQPVRGGHTVEFVADNNVVALQFDVKGISVSEGQYDCGVGLADTHIASCTINSEGNLRVIVFSMENAPVPDGTMVLIRNGSSFATRAELLAAARQTAAPTLDGVVFSDVDAVNVTPDHLK